MEDHKTAPQSERDELNKQLDELRLSQKESVYKEQSDKTSVGKKGSCGGCLIETLWGCLTGTLAAIGGLFLFWKTGCPPPFIMCYSPPPQDKIDEDVKPTCYEIAIPDENNDPDTESSPVDWEPDPELILEDEEAETDPALEELHQYYEKVKRESPVNNADNAETSNEPTE